MKEPLRLKKCYAHGCDAVVPRSYLMCPRHWAMVPALTRRRVLSTWEAWKAGESARPYLIAVMKARLAVAANESKPTSVQQSLTKGINDLEQRLEGDKPCS